MELEFDKEMDAILRKARGGKVLPATAKVGGHVDADTIAAFAENALPQATKNAFIQHFADCDDCRRRLSRAMSINTEIALDPSTVASTAVVTTPWYKGLFRTPGLAFAMGALVLTFSGLLAFLVLQNNESGSAIVSQQTENEPAANGLFSTGARANAVSANTASRAANALSNANSKVASPETTLGEKQISDDKNTAGTVAKESAPREEDNVLRDSSGMDLAKAVPAAPVTVTTDITVTGAEKKDEDAKVAESQSDAENLSKRKMTENRRRDSPPAAAKSGPSRSGPLQNQTQLSNNTYGEMAVTRSVGGKKFSNRDGVWYDTAYRGQATTNYRRSSTDYKSIDSGLRSIADSLGGTVIVVWKGKAYRIN